MALGLALFAVALLGSALASSAFGAKQPMTIKFLEALTYPVTITSLPVEPNEIPSKLENAAGELKGIGFLLTGELTKAGNGNAAETLGSFDALFLKVKKGTEVCTGVGEKAEGEVLANGTLKLVHDVSKTSGLGILFEPTEVVIECLPAKTVIHIKGTQVGLLRPETTELDTTKFEAFLHCSSTIGEPVETKWWSEEEAENTGKLEANFGSGFKKACQDVGKESEWIKFDTNKMLEMAF
jgi:hypothetical protein